MQDFELIHSYTRKQAIEDGEIVELPIKLAREAGILLPVDCTRALWAIVEPSEDLKKMGQSVTGRLWDLFSMLRFAVLSRPDTDLIFYKCLFLQEGKDEPTLYVIKAVLDGGDDGKPIITLMLPYED
jgi:hypothetical protein